MSIKKATKENQRENQDKLALRPEMQKWSHFNYAKTFQSKHFNIQTELTTFSGEKSGCCAGSAVDYR